MSAYDGKRGERQMEVIEYIKEVSDDDKGGSCLNITLQLYQPSFLRQIHE